MPSMPSMPHAPASVLYYGDNLDILRRYIANESVDLIYLDPPFNSNANYNVLFAEKDGKKSAAQIKAFTDTWAWDEASSRAFWEVLQHGGQPAQAMRAFQTLLGENDMLAYLAMMAPRLIELHRVLKPTGSIYLHCDPTASHYLKILMDSIFGPQQFFAEIIWKRWSAHGNSGRYGAVHDVILFYGKTTTVTFNKQYVPYDDEYIRTRFKYADANGRRWAEQNLVNPGVRPNLTYPYTASNGVTYQPHAHGWKFTPERMAELDKQGRLHFPPKGQRLRLKMYLDEQPGAAIQDMWTDIYGIGGSASERLGYPTQKPEALLERIINASSNPGDVVLDPFCGCGTAVIAAQKLGRRWIGIDITHLAVGLMKTRLRDTFGAAMEGAYQVIGEPTTLPDAVKLAEEDKYQFQMWALGLVGARPDVLKKGADRGVDGRLYFHAGDNQARLVVFSVKGGGLKADDIRALGQVTTRENGDIGVLITMEEPTKHMRADAASAGFYTSPWGQHPRLQILTIKDLLDGKKVDMPQTYGANLTFRQAPKAKADTGVTAPSIWNPGVSALDSSNGEIGNDEEEGEAADEE